MSRRITGVTLNTQSAEFADGASMQPNQAGPDSQFERTRSLFPVPLSAFEQYVMLDDHPDYPITFFMQFRLKGQLDLSALVAAYHEAVLMHPLLCCRVERRSGKYWWVWSPEAIRTAELNPDVWRADRPWSKRIDLSSETGLRGWGEVRGTSAEITLQFHHACCDGIGASQFLEDLAVGYSRRTSASHLNAAARELRPELLVTRDRPEPRRIGHLPGSFLRRLGVMLSDTFRYLLQTREQLLPHVGAVSAGETVDFNLESAGLDRTTTRKLRNFVTRNNVSLNDLLVRDLFCAIAAWNEQARLPASGNWICVLVPSNLRGPQDESLPAANVIGYTFLSRTRQQAREPASLLRSLSDEMARVLRDQHGWLFLQALAVVRKIPFLMPLASGLFRERCMSTALLSHMGNRLNSISGRLHTENGVIHVGDTELDQIRCVPALRCGTNVAIATWLFNGQLMVNVRCAPARFGITQTREFLNLFVERLRQSAEESGVV